MRQNKDIISTHGVLYSLYQFTVTVYSGINIILLSRIRPRPLIFFDCSCVCISVSPLCARCLTHFISLISTLGMYSCMTRKTNERDCVWILSRTSPRHYYAHLSYILDDFTPHRRKDGCWRRSVHFSVMRKKRAGVTLPFSTVSCCTRDLSAV